MLTLNDVTPEALSREPTGAENWRIFAEHVLSSTALPLFHYTKLATFKDIVESGTIWATHSQYLNDPSETTYGLKIIEDVIARVSAAYSEKVKRLLGVFPSGLREMRRKYATFFVSFSEHGDLLNQWIAYTPSAAGVAIGVDGTYFTDRYPLRKVLYDPQRQEALVENIVTRSASAIEHAVGDENYDRAMIIAVSLGTLLQIVLLCLKDPAFSLEQEWRVIINGKENELPFRVKYRTAGSVFVPYIELPLREQPLAPVAVSRLVLGPGLDFYLNEPSLSAFSASNDLNLTILPSRIPFRTMR